MLCHSQGLLVCLANGSRELLEACDLRVLPGDKLTCWITYLQARFKFSGSAVLLCFLCHIIYLPRDISSCRKTPVEYKYFIHRGGVTGEKIKSAEVKQFGKVEAVNFKTKSRIGGKEADCAKLDSFGSDSGWRFNLAADKHFQEYKWCPNQLEIS